MAHLDALRESLKPAPKEALVIALTRLAAHYWGDRTEIQWKIIFEDYARDLERFPADIVGEAIGRYRRRGKFWPKVSELIEICEPLASRRARTLMRLRAVCNVPENKTGIVPAIKRIPDEGTPTRAA